MKDKVSNKNYNYIYKAIIVFIVFFYGKYLQLIPIFLFNIKKFSISVNLLLSIFSNLLECLFLIWLFRKDLKNEFIKFKKNIMHNIDVGLSLCFAGVFLMFISNVIISICFSNINSTNESLVQEMIDSIPWLMFINTAILGPIIEEIVFRKSFKLLIKNKWIYALVSGFIFGLMHVIFSFNDIKELAYIFPYAFVGISYALMYNETDTIFTSISMHMLHNAFLTILSII